MPKPEKVIEIHETELVKREAKLTTTRPPSKGGLFGDQFVLASGSLIKLAVMGGATVEAYSPLTPESPATLNYSCSLSSLGYNTQVARHGGIWNRVYLYTNIGQILYVWNLQPLDCLCNTHQLQVAQRDEISVDMYDQINFLALNQDFSKPIDWYKCP